MPHRFARLAAIGVAMTTLVLAGCGDSISMENYEKINQGMTLAQVEDILGSGELQESSGVGISSGGIAGSSSQGDSKRKTYLWRKVNKQITLIFEDGKVTSKTQSGL